MFLFDLLHSVQVDLHHVRRDVHHVVHQGNGDITVGFPGKLSLNFELSQVYGDLTIVIP